MEQRLVSRPWLAKYMGMSVQGVRHALRNAPPECVVESRQGKRKLYMYVYSIIAPWLVGQGYHLPDPTVATYDIGRDWLMDVAARLGRHGLTDVSAAVVDVANAAAAAENISSLGSELVRVDAGISGKPATKIRVTRRTKSEAPDETEGSAEGLAE